MAMRLTMAKLARAQALPASCTVQRSWLRRVPSPAGANITRRLCTDQALKKVLEDDDTLSTLMGQNITGKEIVHAAVTQKKSRLCVVM